MVKPLDVFLRDHVRPMLKEKGFSKKGRDFRLIAPNGDAAVISYLSWRLGERDVEFLVDAGVLPSVWIEWQERTGVPSDRTVANAMWSRRFGSPFNELGLWQLDLNDKEAISIFLGKLAGLADLLQSLINRSILTAEVRNSAADLRELRYSREHSLALLLADEGQSSELEGVLRMLETQNPDDDVASWVRARIATRKQD